MNTLGQVAVGCVFITLILAGCADTPSPSARGENEPSTEQEQIAAASDAAEQVDVKATKTTGVIRGVVVDEAIRPLPSVNVTLTSGPEEATTVTHNDGTFGFSDLAPGAYFLSAFKAGFVDVQVSTEVKAGDDSPAVLRILLGTDPSYVMPYYLELDFKGHLDCTSSKGNLCVGEYLVCTTVGVCPNITNTDSFGEFHIDTAPWFVQAEMFWNPSSPTNERIGMSIAGRGDCDDSANNDTGRDAASPAYVSLNETQLANASTEEGCWIDFSIHGGHQPGVPCYTPPAALGEQCVGLTVNQDYQIIFHAFYGYLPPDGWRFSQEEKVPPP